MLTGAQRGVRWSRVDLAPLLREFSGKRACGRAAGGWGGVHAAGSSVAVDVAARRDVGPRRNKRNQRNCSVLRAKLARGALVLIMSKRVRPARLGVRANLVKTRREAGVRAIVNGVRVRPADERRGQIKQRNCKTSGRQVRRLPRMKESLRASSQQHFIHFILDALRPRRQTTTPPDRSRLRSAHLPAPPRHNL